MKRSLKWKDQDQWKDLDLIPKNQWSCTILFRRYNWTCCRWRCARDWAELCRSSWTGRCARARRWRWASTGMNCIKIGLPGKLILSKRKGLLEVLFSWKLSLRIDFPGRPIFIQLPPGTSPGRPKRRTWSSRTLRGKVCAEASVFRPYHRSNQL